MIRSSLILCALGACLSLSAAALGQSATTSAAPRFEIADVHRSPIRPHPYLRSSLARWNLAPGDRLFLRDATMVDLISETYGVDPTSVFGGPTWLEFDRFDIFAKMPHGSNRNDARVMVRSLLTERFQLALHTGMRPLPAYALMVGKGSKLKQAQEEGGGCSYVPPAQDASAEAVRNVRSSCRNVSMTAFAEFLHEMMPDSQRKPVVDATGLKGGWDLDLEWTYEMPKEGGGTTIFAAVERELGLKLEAKTEPLPVVVVDRVSETPTPNVAGIETMLPPPPAAEFEVATIRPANPEEKHFNIETDPGGRVTIQRASLQTLIAFAWDIGTGKIEDKPKWLDEDLYDIAGKAAADPAGVIPYTARELDPDEVKEMVRSLLAERFQMKSHMEDRPADAFAMVAAKPKMKTADPANHPSCKEGPGPDGKDPRLETPVLSRLISCQNMTMAQLTVELHTLVPGYLPAPVIDATGLSGAYDFTLSFSKSRDLVNPGIRAAGEDASAPEPSGGISLFDAMQKQLGLRLEKRSKVPVPVLVIDHIEQKPSVN